MYLAAVAGEAAACKYSLQQCLCMYGKMMISKPLKIRVCGLSASIAVVCMPDSGHWNECTCKVILP